MPARTLDCRQSAEHRSEAVRQAADTLRDGGLVVFPTETVYGVGASVGTPAAVERLRTIKERPPEKPFTLHVPDRKAVGQYVDLDASPAARRLVDKLMPGPITLVADVGEEEIEQRLTSLGLSDRRSMLYHGHTIGIRCPADETAAELLGSVPAPVVASSANRGGDPSPLDADAAARALGEDVDIVLDGGRTRHRAPSTIVRVQGDEVSVLRSGVYDERYVEKALQQRVLFVCSGNTCRSPMAERLAEAELASRYGVSPDALGQKRLHVTSAGVSAVGGGSMTPESREALRQVGAPDKPHTVRPLTVDMVQEADVIYTMTDSHGAAVTEMVPTAAKKTQRLDPNGDVEDPVGADADGYVRCAERIRALVRSRLDELGL